ncbi:MAG TPA: HAD-IA family hydrolase [Burkholderiaceae bacterium]|nr:HAD-IA family hydrolase [Burkholderiaceae bacterium]
MSLLEFKVLTFDVVGTLIDFERGMLDYLRLAAPNAPVSDDDFLIAYRAERAADDSIFYPDDLARVWRRLAPKLGLPDTDKAAVGFRQSVAQWPAFADSVPALQRLKKHFKLCATTNTQRWAVGNFERTLQMPFNWTVTSDDTGTEKPDPKYFEWFREMLAKRGYTQAENLHVAQSQYHDIGIAKSMGWKTCWIERRAGQKGFGGTLAVKEIARPDWHFTTLAQLADAVEAERR